MPLIYQSEGKSNTYTLRNESYQVPMPPSKDSNKKWLLIQLNILGQLHTEMFVKNMILNVNQAINECLIELYIKYAFQGGQRMLKQVLP